jgi:phosphatidylglycerol:prolipoprotein diacylglycerol transferase
MMPILFKIGSIPVHSFGVMMTLGFLVAGIVAQRDLARKNGPPGLAWSMLGFAMIGGLLGARFHQAVYHWAEFQADPWTFMTSRTGLVWYGGVLGGVLATLWPIRRAGIAYGSAADTAALGLTIGLAIGRIGCHLAGDGDWGTPTDLPWGLAYPHGTAPWPHPPGVRVHPAMLYEMLALFGIFAILLRLRTRIAPPGALFAVYIVLTGFARLMIEFVRTNAPIFLGLTEAQWTSIVLIAGAAVWLRRHLVLVDPGPASSGAR